MIIRKRTKISQLIEMLFLSIMLLSFIQLQLFNFLKVNYKRELSTSIGVLIGLSRLDTMNCLHIYEFEIIMMMNMFSYFLAIAQFNITGYHEQVHISMLNVLSILFFLTVSVESV